MKPFPHLRSFIKIEEYRQLTKLIVVLVAIGTVVFHFVEGWKWLDALYFTVITLSTVGYGDFSPQTNLGKILTMLYIVFGVSVMLGFLNAFFKHRVTQVNEEKRKLNSKSKNT